MNYTHHNIDVLFERWSMVLLKKNLLTISLLVKYFIEVKAVFIILHLIKKVLDFKKFIAPCN